ncbi:hypothetical protein CHU98_g9602 [Xylaria longipes]|nr:hypothetical protein CHU98_g9602 [Xylaria longipes]
MLYSASSLDHDQRPVALSTDYEPTESGAAAAVDDAGLGPQTPATAAQHRPRDRALHGSPVACGAPMKEMESVYLDDNVRTPSYSAVFRACSECRKTKGGRTKRGGNAGEWELGMGNGKWEMGNEMAIISIYADAGTTIRENGFRRRGKPFLTRRCFIKTTTGVIESARPLKPGSTP